MIKWTKEQEQAIYKRGGKVIVSAAAGSGKTAVLSERVIQYILNGGDISRLLIVTFTTLAASEMKERIKNNIEVSIQNSLNNKHLINQSSLVEKAKIMTMDAFYNNIIRENFYILNINPNFKVIDEVEYRLLKEEVAHEVINSKLINFSITKLLDNFCDDKNGFTIEKLIISFNDFINKMPFPLKWLDKIKTSYQVKNFNSSIWSNILYHDLLLNFDSFITLYQEIIEEIMGDDILNEKLSIFFTNELNLMQAIKKFILNKELDNIYTSIKGFNFEKFPTIRNNSDNPLKTKAKNLRDNFKKIIRNYQSIIDFMNEESFLNDLKEYQTIIGQLIDITKAYRMKLQEKLKQENCFGFEDIPHLVLELLISDYDYENGHYERTKYALDIAEQFDEILIDEFQDTNMVQYLIFDSISQNQKNLFMVGDVKQSIYAFRSARPELLTTEKKKAFEDKFPLLINLGQNFRSRKEVLDFCNYLFSKIMTEDFGEIKYDINEQLNLGAYYEQSSNIEPELYLLTSNKDEEIEEDLKDIEKEAIFISHKIKELINNNYQVYDSKKQIFRNLKLNDIAILLRAGTHSDTFRKALINEGIDVYTENTPIYFDNYEVKLIIAILQIINNPYDDIALTTVLHSPVFAFSPDLLYKIRKIDNKDYLYNNMKKIDDKKITDFITKLDKYRLLTNELSIYQLINYIYNDTKILAIFSHMDNGSERVKNLLEMVNHAVNFMNNDNHPLYEFIKYIEKLIENEDSLLGTNPTSEKDSVLITTIHKSKGLEFPIVFLPTLNIKFNFMDLSNNILLDSDYYLGFKIRNYNNYTVNSNLILELLKKYKLNKQLSEELRILYVAITRAKEKLIMSASINNLENKCIDVNSLIGNDEKINPSYLINSQSYLDWVLALSLKDKSGKCLRDLANIETKLYNDEVKFKIEVVNNNDIYQTKTIINSNQIVDVDINKIIQKFENNQTQQFTNYKTKITATELKKDLNSYQKPSYIDERAGLGVGTIYHKIIEHLPFINYDSESIEITIKQLIDNNIISSEQFAQINVQKIINFFMTDLYINNIINSTCYREYDISFNAPIKEIDITNDSNEIILVEGTIDLLCIYDNEYTIIDYKSDIVDSEEELVSRYQKQLNLYSVGIEKIYNTTSINKYIYSFSLGKFIKID